MNHYPRRWEPFHSLAKPQASLSSPMSPLFPILGNPCFTPGYQDEPFKNLMAVCKPRTFWLTGHGQTSWTPRAPSAWGFGALSNSFTSSGPSSPWATSANLWQPWRNIAQWREHFRTPYWLFIAYWSHPQTLNPYAVLGTGNVSWTAPSVHNRDNGSSDLHTNHPSVRKSKKQTLKS